MHNTLVAIQMIFAILLIAMVLIQSKGKGFGRGMGTSPASFTRRGLEEIIFKATFVVALVFIIVSIAIFVV